MVLSGVVASASLPEKSSSLSRHRDLESMLGVPASGLPLSSLDAARTRNDRCARDRRVRDTIAPPVRADANATLAVPIGAAVAILSVHVMAPRVSWAKAMESTLSMRARCTVAPRGRPAARLVPVLARSSVDLSAIVLATILSRSSGCLAGGERRWKTFWLGRMDVAAENDLFPP